MRPRVSPLRAGQPVSRDARIHRTMYAGLAAVLIISLLGLAARHLDLGHPDFMSGFSTGVLMTLPLAIAVMVYRTYAQMDEYGQRLHQKAAAFGFMVAMIATTEYLVVSEQHLLSVPGWTLYLVGMGAYTAAVLWLGRGEREQ